MQKKDRRQFIRLEVYHLAKYKLVSDKGEPSYVLATAKDIGAGGLCLITEESLPLSSLVQLKINFPGISTSIFALAKIVWIKQIKKTRRYEIGAQFVEIDESIRKDIDGRIKFVHNKVEKKSGLLKFVQYLERRTKK